jgi:wyosine [tRNA(Phe)-imidazoG37] synthetase (radical SAM superfamily)
LRRGALSEAPGGASEENQEDAMPYVFGPVPSRRLGRSLGVDLVPLKTCSYDCIYCQLGRTTNKTLERREWVPVDDVVAEVKERLATCPDFITFSGSGEPTLHSRIGDVIDAVRKLTSIPVAVITNGSLLWQRDVRRQLRDADVVIPSLDAGDAGVFQTVNRPHEGLEYGKMVRGLMDFRMGFAGQYWLEIMLLAGHTATDEQVRKIAAIAQRIRPDRIHINTATRPTAEVFATAAGAASLKRCADLLPGQVEVIADRIPAAGVSSADGEPEVLELLRRRPCTTVDVADALRLNMSEAIKHIDHLALKGLVRRRRAGGRTFFSAPGRSAAPGRSQRRQEA